ncbi:MAG TPA: hypothetical protein PLT26_08110 [Anaerolineaceae bacterium]|nr:hypothetical protein [Anaerolineaceae bacterium]
MSVNERAAFSLQASQVLPATVLASGSLGSFLFGIGWRRDWA